VDRLKVKLSEHEQNLMAAALEKAAAKAGVELGFQIRVMFPQFQFDNDFETLMYGAISGVVERFRPTVLKSILGRKRPTRIEKARAGMEWEFFKPYKKPRKKGFKKGVVSRRKKV
jgi:hypothetical protein